MKLPDFRPSAPWQPAPVDYRPAEYGSVYPPVRKLEGGRIAIDQCRRADGGYEVRVFDNVDHPNLASLPQHTPRVVKLLFRREWQLKYLRATDASPILRDLDAAHAAWQSFQEGSVRR